MIYSRCVNLMTLEDTWKLKEDSVLLNENAVCRLAMQG